jgi:hypothetical protein
MPLVTLLPVGCDALRKWGKGIYRMTGIDSSERQDRSRRVVERTLACLNCCRASKVSYERRLDIHQTFFELGAR